MAKYRFFIVATALTSLVSTAVLAEDNQPKHRIAVDVGHSTQMPGATSAQGVPEFNFNVALAKKVTAELSKRGDLAFMIGADGDIANLYKRTELATKAGATFFLSIHHDSVQPIYLKSWNWKGAVQHYDDSHSGFSLFVSRRNAHLNESLLCASAIGAVLLKSGFHYSSHHSEASQGEKKEWADKTNGVYYYDDLAVLRTADQPAVLLEAGIIVNRKDAVELQETATQQRIAQAIRLGMQQCGIIK